MLAEIRKEKAEARRMKQQSIAREKLAGLVDAYEAAGVQAIEEAASRGLRVQGVSTLAPGDLLTANRAGGDDPEEYLGQSRNAGLELSRKGL
jgi:hypothetical protein